MHYRAHMLTNILVSTGDKLFSNTIHTTATNYQIFCFGHLPNVVYKTGSISFFILITTIIISLVYYRQRCVKCIAVFIYRKTLCDIYLNQIYSAQLPRIILFSNKKSIIYDTIASNIVKVYLYRNVNCTSYILFDPYIVIFKATV